MLRTITAIGTRTREYENKFNKSLSPQVDEGGSIVESLGSQCRTSCGSKFETDRFNCLSLNGVILLGNMTGY